MIDETSLPGDVALAMRGIEEIVRALSGPEDGRACARMALGVIARVTEIAATDLVAAGVARAMGMDARGAARAVAHSLATIAMWLSVRAALAQDDEVTR